jgi:hypothetical protein
MAMTRPCAFVDTIGLIRSQGHEDDMTRTGFKCSATVSMWCALVVATAGAPLQNAANELVVNDPRPLSAAIEELERRHGWAVTYEDPPYEFAGDAIDVTEAVRRNNNPSDKRRVHIPLGGSFTFAYSGAPSTVAEAQAVLAAMVRSYHQSGNAGVFRLLRTGETLHVIPVRSNNASGALPERRSRLDVPITLEARDRSALEMLQAVLQHVRAQGANVLEGALPVTMLAEARVQDGAQAETARVVLMRALAATGRRMSWQLLCGPGVEACYFNVHLLVN